MSTRTPEWLTALIEADANAPDDLPPTGRPTGRFVRDIRFAMTESATKMVVSKAGYVKVKTMRVYQDIIKAAGLYAWDIKERAPAAYAALVEWLKRP